MRYAASSVVAAVQDGLVERLWAAVDSQAASTALRINCLRLLASITALPSIAAPALHACGAVPMLVHMLTQPEAMMARDTKGGLVNPVKAGEAAPAVQGAGEGVQAAAARVLANVVAQSDSCLEQV
jgi:hypothetical protein